MTATLDRRADYVSAVAVELADLPAEERGELVEELDDHVAALLEDRPDVDLVTELGTPRAYAAELRAAAGLTATAAATRPGLRAWVRDLATAVDARTPDRLRPYLAALRTTWWAFRGYALVAATGHVLGFGWSGSGLGALLPAPGGVWLFGLVLCVAAAAASVRLGAWRPRSAGRRALLVAVNVLAILGAFVLAGSARYVSDSEPYYDTQYLPNCPIELDNLYAYDASGQALDDVRLYDQYGTPFDLSTFGCNVGGQFAPGSAGVNAYPWPTAGTEVFGGAPTGPPATLTPLPGATVASDTPSPTGATSAAGTPGPTGTPSPTGTP